MRFWHASAAILVLIFCGCGVTAVDPQLPEEERLDYRLYPYAQAVVEFNPGQGSGFGQDTFPDVVLGPPHGLGAVQGSMDVLSLGAAGEIILDFSPRTIVDGEGVDFVVFENVFWPGNDSTNPWKELAEVSVSQDGEDWFTFTCTLEPQDPGEWPGCAGWSPTQPYTPDPKGVNPESSGGDFFDLAELGLTSARYVRIRDLSGEGAAPSVGFDLDAVGLVSFVSDEPAE